MVVPRAPERAEKMVCWWVAPKGVQRGVQRVLPWEEQAWRTGLRWAGQWAPRSVDRKASWVHARAHLRVAKKVVQSGDQSPHRTQ